MARRLYATAPDGTIVSTQTDRDYKFMVIGRHGGWHRVSAHATYQAAYKRYQRLLGYNMAGDLDIVPVRDTK